MSKELPGGTHNDFSVFSLLRNFDRYNDDNFKLSETPPGGENSSPKPSMLKNTFQTFGQEEKNTVTIHSSGPTVMGFSPSVSSLVNRDNSQQNNPSADNPESKQESNRLITDEVLRNRLSAMTLGTQCKTTASEAEASAPHSEDKMTPSSQALSKLYEKAIGRHASQSQPSSPRLPRKLIRNASIDSFETIIGRQGQMKGDVVAAGKGQVLGAAPSAVVASSAEKEHQRTMTALPESSTEEVDSPFQEVGRPRSMLGQWLWGKQSKVTVKDRELNFISPTSF